jgi:hypothetical protein
MNNFWLKKASLFLIFKDCINNSSNDFNNSLFAKIWLTEISENNIRKNREDSYTREFVKSYEEKIKLFLENENVNVDSEDGYINLFEKYLKENPVSDIVGCSFESLGTNDKIRLTRGCLDCMQEEYAIVILYYPIQEEWEYVKEKLKNNSLTIFSEYTIDMTGNQIGFINLIHDIYNDYDRSEESLIVRKIRLLIKSKLILKVLIVRSETNDVYEKLGKIKLEIRDILTFTSDKNAFLNMHTPENINENDHLKRVLVSVNNLWYVSNRLVSDNETEFIKKLSLAQHDISNTGLKLSENVVVSTGAMEAAGIWICNDIDVIGIKTANGLKYVDFFNHEYNQIECSEKKLSNKCIIFDDNNYFVFAGMKFANLEIIRERNIFSYSLDASKKKVACINSFYNFIRYVDDKEILNEEIKIEFARRNKEQSVHIYRRALRKAGRIVKKILKR